MLLTKHVLSSPSRTTNPLTYSSLQTLREVHGQHSESFRKNASNPSGFQTDIGEVWANMLHNVYAGLVAAHGWTADARTNPNGTQGNVVHLHLFLDALLLQPCNPTCVSTFQ